MPIININPSADNLLKSMQTAGVYLPAVCGGKGTCGKCKVKLISGSLTITDADKKHFAPHELEAGWRLACAAVAAEKIAVEVASVEEQQFYAVNEFHGKAANSTTSASGNSSGEKAAPRYGIAVDIGTTTLGFALVELHTQKTAAFFSAVNKQRQWGADVITRIQSANGGNLSAMSQCVRGQIAEGINALCVQAKLASSQIEKIVVVGNTVMLHLLMNLSCQTLGQAPFTPVTLDMAVSNSGEILGGNLPGELIVLPGISAYVGADITAGLYFAELHSHTATTAFMDIGTNGEMALAHGGKILCTATAAGPAFEGGNIRCGMGSVPGAISHAEFSDGKFSLTTIGGKPPEGICGSGLISLVHECLKHGLVSPDGRFSEKIQGGEIALAKTAAGRAIADGRDITLTQKDVRELQLAKSAIRSGFDALLNHAGLAYNDIDTLYIAGGFGFNINLESAASIGLIPTPLVPKVFFVGNSALGGAVKYLLNPDDGEALRRLSTQAIEFNLPADKFFSEQFIANMGLE